MWTIGSYRLLTVKACYIWLIECIAGYSHHEDNDMVKACSKIWKCDVRTKAIINVWRLLLNRLPTRDTIVRRGVVDAATDSCCVGCFEEEENVFHLYFECAKSRDVCTRILCWLDALIFPCNDSAKHFLAFDQQLNGSRLKRLKHLVWTATMWVIWHVRNKTLLEGAIFNINSIVTHVKTTF